MAIEIERKFLVSSFPKDLYDYPSERIDQGYLSTEPERVVRVRIGDTASLTIKGITNGITRKEFEYQIPYSDALSIFVLCGMNVIHKTRYDVEFKGTIWSVDVFDGRNESLVVAEVEIAHEDFLFMKPDWIGEEVSYDPRYSNSSLALKPYSTW